MKAAQTSALVVAGLVTLAADGGTDQGQRFSSRVDAVRVDVLVTAGDRIVQGLTASDFVVLDNGVPQTVNLVSFDELPLNVILALDMSDSVAGSRLRNLRRAGRVLLDGLEPTDQSALITFNHAVVLAADLTHDVSHINAALDDAAAFGSTSLVDATYAGIILGETDLARSLLIVFSDGLDTSSYFDPRLVLDTARRTDTVVYAVSAGTPDRARYLGELSALTGGRLFEVGLATDVSALFLQVLEEFRQRYLISYVPDGVPADGWHELTVRVRERDVTIQARPGYLSGPGGN